MPACTKSNVWSYVYLVPRTTTTLLRGGELDVGDNYLPNWRRRWTDTGGTPQTTPFAGRCEEATRTISFVIPINGFYYQFDGTYRQLPSGYYVAGGYYEKLRTTESASILADIDPGEGGGWGGNQGGAGPVPETPPKAD